MKLEFRLKQILERLGRFGHGIYKRIEDETGISRKVLQSICLNSKRTVSFDVLERLCDWLLENNAGDDLPGALIGFQPSTLTAALRRPNSLNVYLGEYRNRTSAPLPRAWIARADAQVASRLVELLTSSATRDLSSADHSRDSAASDTLQPKYVYVPSHFSGFGATESEPELPADPTRKARELYQEYRTDYSGASGIFIGSQRANFMMELFVADLFDCQPFSMQPGDPPFYLYKPTDDHLTTESCFGGGDPPPGGPDKAEPGIYYRERGGAWVSCPWNEETSDAGIVIVRRDPGRGQTDVAIFGFSGRATLAVGDYLRRNPDAFWTELEPFGRGIEARVFVCPIRLKSRTEKDGDQAAPVVERVDVKALTLNRRFK